MGLLRTTKRQTDADKHESRTIVHHKTIIEDYLVYQVEKTSVGARKSVLSRPVDKVGCIGEPLAHSNLVRASSLLQLRE